MTREEELPLVIAAKAGNQAAIYKLHKQYERMIKKACWKFKILDTLTPEDLYQESYFYFISALEKFDITKNAKFGTFLTGNLMQLSRYVVYEDFVIRRPGDYFTTIKSDEASIIKRFAMDAPMNEKKDTFIDTFVDMGANFLETIENRQELLLLRKLIKQELNKLNAFDRTVFELYFYGNVSAVELTRQFNIGLHYIKKIRRSTLDRIKEAYDDYVEIV